MLRPGFLADATNLGNSDPFDLSVCWPQYVDEAKQIVQGIRNDIDRARANYPGEAQALEQKVIDQIQQHRNTNTCPNISEGQHQFTDEWKALQQEASALAQRPGPAAGPSGPLDPGAAPISLTSSGPILAPDLVLPEDDSGDTAVLLGGGLLFMLLLGVGAFFLLRSPSPAPAPASRRRKRKR